MTPTLVRQKVAIERAAWIRDMLGHLRALPIADEHAFVADFRNIATADSCLRRALEALFDLSRHVLGKAFGASVAEYKSVARELHGRGVIDESLRDVMVLMAGYRNRLTHFYDLVTPGELFQILQTRLDDIDQVLAAILGWMDDNPDRVDPSL